jgi:hypothetical protein
MYSVEFEERSGTAVTALIRTTKNLDLAGLVGPDRLYITDILLQLQ